MDYWQHEAEGLYLVNADDSLASTFLTYTKAFSNSYTLTAGQRYAIGVLGV